MNKKNISKLFIEELLKDASFNESIKELLQKK